MAARLREVKKTGFDFTWCKICMVVCGPECPVGCDDDEMAVDAAKRLADLIEPEPERTCRMTDNGCELCCSLCDTRHGYDDEPNYCMGCGAKVMNHAV